MTILKHSRYKKSYADTVSNSNVKGNNGLYYSYNSVFSEYTTKGQGISCSNYANCYIGCTCRSGWNKRSASASDVVDGGSLKTAGAKAVSTAGTKANVSTMAEGDSCTVSITDPRYGTTCSISTTKDCAGVCDGSAYFRCTSGSTSSYCPSGKYSVDIGKQQCSSGSATNSTSCYTCRDCTYSCPPGYSTSSYCSSGYYAVSTTKSKDQNVSTCPASTDKCYKCVAKTCSDYGLYSSSQSGMHCSSVSKDPGLTCYSCHTPNYTWCPSGSQIGSCSSGYYVSGTKPKECTSCSATSGTCNVCSKCTYSCPNGYYEEGSTWSDYKLTSTKANKVCNGDSSQTNSELCYTRTLKTCKDYGFKSSIPSGQTCKDVSPRSGLTCYKDCEEEGCPDGYYEDVPDSSANNYINFSTSNGCYKPISCKPGYYPNRAFYDQLESPVATYKNFTCFPARYFVDFGCPMLNNDIECSKNGEGWHIVGRSYHTNTGEPLPGSVTITISGSKGCDGSLTYTDSDFPGTNNTGEQKCYYKTGCTDVIGATYTSKTSDPRVEVIMDCSENSDFECPAGYSSEKPDDRYFVYNTEDWDNTATGKVTTCYNTTGCKEGYTQYDNGTTGYTSTDGFVCYKNSSCDNSNGWYSDMPDDIYFNYETQDLGDGLYCYRVTGCNADNGYIADDNGYISWHNVKCGEDNEPPYFTVSKAGSLTGISDITSITVKLSKSYPSDIHCTLNFSGFSGSQMNERFYMGPLNVTVPANTTSKSVSVNMRSLNINCPVGNGGFDDCAAGYIMLDYDTYCDNAAISYDLQDIITRGANTASSREFNDIVHEYILNF